MKIIKLTAKEYYNFKMLAKFNYEAYPTQGIVFVEANEEDLTKLGY